MTITVDTDIPEPTTNVIQFPIKNIRYSMEGIPTDESETLEAVKSLKIAYFNKIAEDIVAYTSFVIDNNLYHNSDTDDFKEPTIRDIILVHEAIVAVLCRINSIDHPLHEIGEREIGYEGDENNDFELDNSSLYYFKRTKEKSKEGDTQASSNSSSEE